MSLVTAHFHISLITVTNGAMTIIRSEQNETRWSFCHDKLRKVNMVGGDDGRGSGGGMQAKAYKALS